MLTLAALLTCTGCAARTQPKPDRLTDQALRPDPAMERRDWDTATASYPNGSVIAGPTEFSFEPKRNQAGYAYYGADTATFLLNVAVMPYNLVVTPPWTKQNYPGAVIPPSSTGMPVLAGNRQMLPPPAPPASQPPPTSKGTPTFAPAPTTSMTGLPPTAPSTRMQNRGSTAPATTRPAATTRSSTRGAARSTPGRPLAAADWESLLR